MNNYKDLTTGLIYEGTLDFCKNLYKTCKNLYFSVKTCIKLQFGGLSD